MLSHQAFEVLVSQVSPEDFYAPAHIAVAAAMRKLWESAIIVSDPVILADELEAAGQLEAVGGKAELLSILAGTGTTTNSEHYARVVTDLATLRRLIAAGAEITELGYTSSDMVSALEQARELVNFLHLPVGNTEPSPTIDDVLETEIHYDWVVPGLIERTDRLILTGGEGMGKSTLIRQMAVQVAAGMHPFRFGPIPAANVLMVDCENSLEQVHRKLRPLREIVRGRLDPERLRIEVHPEGLDLTQSTDRRWLVERVHANRPDVVTIGPIYKLHDGDPNEEGPAKVVSKLLDTLRVKYRCAVILEAHSPHGDGARRDLRPIGASLWRRWPEFGYGLRLLVGEQHLPGTVAFEPWRGDRDVREWPDRLARDTIWPWRDADHNPEPERW